MRVFDVRIGPHLHRLERLTSVIMLIRAVRPRSADAWFGRSARRELDPRRVVGPDREGLTRGM